MLSRKFSFYILLLIVLEGGFFAYLLLRIPGERSSLPFGLSPLRLGMIAGLAAFQLMLIAIAIGIRRDSRWANDLIATVSGLFKPRSRQLGLQYVLINLFLASSLLIFQRYSTTDRQIIGILERLMPILLYALLVSVQVFLLIQANSSRRRRAIWLSAFAGVLLFAGVQYCLNADLFSLERLPFLLIILNIVVSGVLLLARNLSRREAPGRRSVFLPLSLAMGFTALLFISTNVVLEDQVLLQSPIYFAFALFAAQLYLYVKEEQAILGSLTRFKYGYIALLFILLSVIYITGAQRHSELQNNDIERSDQRQFLSIAARARETGFDYKGNRNQMPLYPFILALFHNEELSENEFFDLSKNVGIWLSLGLLGGLFLLSRRLLPLYQAVLLVIIASFSMWIFRAGYVKVELLYYFLSFSAFVLFCSLLAKPTFGTSVLAGLVVGLAYLSKASILPALVLFLIVALLKAGWLGFRAYREGPGVREVRNTILSPIVLLLIFLLVISSYIMENKAIYGEYFFNVNTSFIMWFGSFEEAREAMTALGPPENWAEISSEDLPGLRNYLQEHSIGEIGGRFLFGLNRQFFYFATQFNTFNYLLGMLVFAAIFALAALRLRIKVEEKYRPVVIFGIVYFLVYILLFAFYSSISGSARFVHSIFLPLIFSCFMLINYVLDKTMSSSRDKPGLVSSTSVETVNLILGVFLIPDIYYVVSELLIIGHYGA